MFMRLAAILCVLLAFSCTKKVAEVAVGGGPMTTTTYGEQAEVMVGSGLVVTKTPSAFTFMEVLSDSRCPKGVDCIRAGEAIVRVVLADGSEQNVKINADGKNRASFAVPDGSVEILGLEPYPEARVKINPAGYRLKVRITKAAVQ
ncbi:hypothetical protein [Neolewinella agarilytica]|uniref:Uncharacterized protein n=1 Tax=Neolewinella agarilytica TaxID=478744 RepID=A0A1H9JKJ3_9BACT|nr:hypothetical protein [Neolewinella agarilytica]SEQ87317.1 hypothetical protein SAMN05444359_117115 [Neolewinella agarilytica]